MHDPAATATHRLAAPRPPRILVFGATSFPRVDQEFFYEMTRRTGDRLDAEVRYAYAFAAESEQALPHTLRWLGRGRMLPDLPHSQHADLEHFRLHSPDALASLLECVGRCFGTTADPARMPAIALAISQARWVKAWAPDILFSLSGSDGCLAAMVASWLLDIPRVHFHFTPPPDDAPDFVLNHEYYGRADLVAVPAVQSMTSLTESLTRTIGARLRPLGDAVDWQQLLARDVARLLRHRPHSTTRADLGHRAAWGAPPTTTAVDQSPALPRPFLVIGTARTGSNLLVDLLNSHPRLLTAGELFQPEVTADNIVGAGLPEGYPVTTYLEMRQHDPGACIQYLRTFGAARGAAVVGCKLFHHHAVADNRLVDSLLAMPDLRLIYLSRLDHVARYLSLQRALLSGTWFATADQPSPKRAKEPIHLDPRLMLHDLELTESIETRIRETFAGIPSLDVSYEDLVADREGQMRRVFEFLGVELVAPASLSLKTGESDPRAMIANWEALEAMLAGTRWNHQFDRDAMPSADREVSRGTHGG